MSVGWWSVCCAEDIGYVRSENSQSVVVLVLVGRMKILDKKIAEKIKSRWETRKRGKRERKKRKTKRKQEKKREVCNLCNGVILRLALGWKNYLIGIARGTVDSELLPYQEEEGLKKRAFLAEPRLGMYCNTWRYLVLLLSTIVIEYTTIIGDHYILCYYICCILLLCTAMEADSISPCWYSRAL